MGEPVLPGGLGPETAPGASIYETFGKTGARVEDRLGPSIPRFASAAADCYTSGPPEVGGAVRGSGKDPFMPELACVNGSFCDLAEARVSVEDRGFQFADGVYEVVVAYGSRIIGLDAHLARLQRSLEGIGLAFDVRTQRIEELIAEGIARAGFPETMAYLQITRGAAPRSHAWPADLTPTVVATFKAKPKVDPERRRRGLSVMTMPDTRWSRCYIKSIALLANVLAKDEARRGGYDDTVFVGPGGKVREATAANIFLVADGTLITPPKSDAILHGVTRGFVLECAARIALPHREAEILEADLLTAQELFLSSTTVDFIGVTRLNDRAVGDGRVGPITGALFEQFQRTVARPAD
ncbi:MAG: D-amino acid aminotransferase [bacterium]|nr:D-amino acid aminotransferase [bacterium]